MNSVNFACSSCSPERWCKPEGRCILDENLYGCWAVGDAGEGENEDEDYDAIDKEIVETAIGNGIVNDAAEDALAVMEEAAAAAAVMMMGTTNVSEEEEGGDEGVPADYLSTCQFAEEE
jgi:hypothetical protein